MNHLRITGWILLMILILPVRGQDSVPAVPNGRIIQDTRLNQLIALHIKVNEKMNGLDGFRIQIFFDSGTESKSRAREAIEVFTQKYIGIEAYLTFQSPNYKVRVGNFRTRLDALRCLHEIAADYPNAFIITDRINLPNVE